MVFLFQKIRFDSVNNLCWFTGCQNFDQFPGKSILRGQLNKDIEGYLFASVVEFLPTQFQPQQDQFFDQLLSQNFSRGNQPAAPI